VLVDGERRAKLMLAWTSLWCIAPVQNDRVVLEWPGGGRLEVDGFGESPGCNNPGSGEARGVDVLPFEPERWSVKEGPRVLSPIEARQVDFAPGSDGGPSMFVVELLAPERDMSLGICPDAELHARHSFDDESIVAYGLNCADVPFKDAGGTPYLPHGVPVRFAVDMTFQDPFAAYSWRLDTPTPVATGLTVPVLSPEDARMDPGQGEGNFYVDVTNQSFLDSPVRIRIWIDEALVVDEEFEVGGQHEVTTFGYRVPPGEHGVRVVCPWDDRVWSVRIGPDATRFAKVSYWHYEGEQRHLEWEFQDTGFLYD
jgi:hypothetical protein